jgi:hypothetical protein
LLPTCFELGAQSRFGERMATAESAKRSSTVAERRPNANGLTS